MTKKRLLSSLLCPALVLSMTACSGTSSAAPEASAAKESSVKTTSEAPAPAVESNSLTNTAAEEPTAPKYVFLFIGDGMSYPQFQAASDYLGAVADTDYANALPSTEYDTRNGAVLDGPVRLNFMDFAVDGSAITYDSCSFAPDSASTATSIATGNKTYSGILQLLSYRPSGSSIC